MDFGTKSSDLYAMIPVVAVSCMWNTLNLTASVVQQLKVGKCQTAFLLISCISLSNVLLELSMLGLVAMVQVGLFCLQEVHPVIKAVLFLWLHSICMSFWSVAWLTVFYCVKIVNASSPFTEAMKRNISVMINVVLVLTTVAAVLMDFPIILIQVDPELSKLMASDNYTQNTTCELLTPILPLWMNTKLYVSIVVGVLCVLPLMVMVTTSLRLVVYLCRHTLSMKQNKTEIQSADSYLLLCRLTLSLVGIYLATLSMIALYFIFSVTSMTFGLIMIVPSVSFYCIGTAVLLTILNKHLKERLLSLLCCKENSRTGNSTENMTAALS